MSRRKELDEYMNEGRLRDAVTGELSDEAIELLLDIVMLRARSQEPSK